MRVTLGICTWNRPATLARTLHLIADRLRVPSDLAWELLVVVNGEGANAQESVNAANAMAKRLPIRTALEPEVGIARARNRVLSEAQGEYLVWTDDDVRVDAEWLEAYLHAFTKYPDVAIFGGTIRPWFEREPPLWMRETLPTMLSAHGIVHPPAEGMPITSAQPPYGANTAVRTEAARSTPFHVTLGAVGRKRLGGEETTAIREMLAKGYTGVWVPGAIVEHFVPQAHLTRSYIRRYNHASGYVLAHNDPAPRSVTRLFGRPRWLFREALYQEARYWATRWTAAPSTWVDAMQRASRAWGMLSGAR